MLKQQKGITLVALVITIIVLIILAAVSISLVLGEYGFISRAKSAAADYQAAGDAEKADLQTIDSYIDQQLGTEDTDPDGE